LTPAWLSDYLSTYVAELSDYRVLEQLRRIMRLLPSLKVVTTGPGRDPAPLWLLPFARLLPSLKVITTGPERDPTSLWLLPFALLRVLAQVGDPVILILLATYDFAAMQKQLMEPAVKGTLNVLYAARDCGVNRVVLGSSKVAMVPNPNWPADRSWRTTAGPTSSNLRNFRY
jgi:hypothetical protein